MKIAKIMFAIVIFSAFAAFCIFEGSHLMMNIGALVLVGVCMFGAAYGVTCAIQSSKIIKSVENLCPACADGILCPLRSLSVKRCQSCGHSVPWELKEGQLPLVANNRQVKKK